MRTRTEEGTAEAQREDAEGAEVLDLARYAESEGFKADETRPNAWRYRDYVIKSFNSNKPYDRFIKEQIAGDELWPENPDALVATGFNRHYPDESNARDLIQRRQDILNDVTDTVGAVFMATTYACARCHDHKFDPVLQKDYYRLQAFFAATRAKDDFLLASIAEQDEYKRKRLVWEERTREIRAQIARLEEPVAAAIYKDNFDKYPPRDSGRHYSACREARHHAVADVPQGKLAAWLRNG